MITPKSASLPKPCKAWAFKRTTGALSQNCYGFRLARYGYTRVVIIPAAALKLPAKALKDYIVKGLRP